MDLCDQKIHFEGINHVGTLANDHYTAIVKNRTRNRFSHCDDRSMIPC